MTYEQEYSAAREEAEDEIYNESEQLEASWRHTQEDYNNLYKDQFRAHSPLDLMMAWHGFWLNRTIHTNQLVSDNIWQCFNWIRHSSESTHNHH